MTDPTHTSAIRAEGLAKTFHDPQRGVVEAVKGVDIDRVIVMDGGDGTGVENAVNQRVRGAYGTMEALASTLGIDLEEVLQGASARLTSGDAEE